MQISATSTHFEQIVNDIVCVERIIEIYLIFEIFYKDTNKYSKKQEKLKFFLK
jgi:hypothetical protein